MSWCCTLVLSGLVEFNFWETVLLWDRFLVKETVPKTNDRSSSVGLTGGVECGRPYLLGRLKERGRDSLSLGSIRKKNNVPLFHKHYYFIADYKYHKIW